MSRKKKSRGLPACYSISEQRMQDARVILSRSRHLLSGAEMDELARVANGSSPKVILYDFSDDYRQRVPFHELQTEFSHLL